VVRLALEGLQRRLWFRIAASIIVLVVAMLTIGRAALAGSTFSGHFNQVLAALQADDAHIWGSDLLEFSKVNLAGLELTIDPALAKTLIAEDGAISNPLEIASLLMGPLTPTGVPNWLWAQPSVAWGMTAAAAATGLLVVWTGIFPLFVLLGGLGGIGVMLLLLGDSPGGALALASIVVLVLLFQGLLRLCIAVLECFGPTGAVAATVLRESGRSRVALAFVIALLVLLPLLPLSLDAGAPLRHQVQSLMDRSLSLSFALVAVMTMAVGCSTIAFDIRDRHIWHLVSKPLGTGRYLLGKWVGVIGLNAILLTVAATFSAAWVGYLRLSPPPNSMDAGRDMRIVSDELLTTRDDRLPDYPVLTESEMQSKVEQILRDDPEYAQYAEGVAPPRLVRALRAEVREEYSRTQRRAETLLSPSQDPWRTVRFSGLQYAKAQGEPLRLRFRLLGSLSDEHERRTIGIALNGQLDSGVVGAFRPTLRQNLDISPAAVRDDGTLEVTFVNLTQVPVPPGTQWRPADLRALLEVAPIREPFAIFWEPKGVEILFPASSFGANYARAQCVQWVRLAALAAVACFTATFLSFPVACLASLTILVGAVLGPFLAIALQYFTPPPLETVEGFGQMISWGIDSFIRTVASSLVYMLGSFGEFSAIERLVQGRLIGWDMVWRSVLQLGAAWCLPTLVLGWLIMRNRQLAIYSGDS
jgi:hypothetical protein